MKIRPFLSILVLLPWLLAVAGCDGSSTAPEAAFIPNGSWQLQNTDPGGAWKYSQVITLSSQTSGTEVDTTYTFDGGKWVAGITRLTRLAFRRVGDGYQRCIALTTTSGSAKTDTTLTYRYYFLRGDSLCEYSGWRFVGPNGGLIGRWDMPAGDTAILPKAVSLTFTSDSMTYDDGWRIKHFAYRTSRNTLSFISGNPFSVRTRYEIIPGWSLYITAPEQVYGPG